MTAGWLFRKRSFERGKKGRVPCHANPGKSESQAQRKAILLIRLAFVKPAISQYKIRNTTLPAKAASPARDDAEAKRCMAPPPLRLYNALVFIDRHFGNPLMRIPSTLGEVHFRANPTKIAGQGNRDDSRFKILKLTLLKIDGQVFATDNSPLGSHCNEASKEYWSACIHHCTDFQRVQIPFPWKLNT